MFSIVQVERQLYILGKMCDCIFCQNKDVISLKTILPQSLCGVLSTSLYEIYSSPQCYTEEVGHAHVHVAFFEKYFT